MKKIEICLVVLILAILAVTLCGCGAPKEPKVTLRGQTMSLTTTVLGYQWIEAFGDTVDTAQSFNLMLLNNEADALKKKIEALELKVKAQAKRPNKLTLTSDCEAN